MDTLIEKGTLARYAHSGHLVYATIDGSVMAVPFDLEQLQLKGAPVPVLENVGVGLGARTVFALSRNGTLVYILGSRSNQLVVVDQGVAQPLMEKPGFINNPKVAPDGKRVALAIREAGKSDIWIYDIARETMPRLTLEGFNNGPIWTPDGKRVIFHSNRAGSYDLYWRLADGSTPTEPLLIKEKSSQYVESISSDGQILFFTDSGDNPGRGVDIWTLPLDSERKAMPLIQTQFVEDNPILSPDGKWLAYQSDESGQQEVYVCTYPDPSGGKWTISSDGGWSPIWAPNGRTLYYRNGRKLVAVAIETATGFRAGMPKALFEGRYVHRGQWNYDIFLTADGSYL